VAKKYTEWVNHSSAPHTPLDADYLYLRPTLSIEHSAPNKQKWNSQWRWRQRWTQHDNRTTHNYTPTMNHQKPINPTYPNKYKGPRRSPATTGGEGAVRRESVPVQPHHTPPGAWPRHPQAVHHLGHSVEDLPRPLPVSPQLFQKYYMVEILIGRFHSSQLKPGSEVAGGQLS
jgi:hypothetical protein